MNISYEGWMGRSHLGEAPMAGEEDGILRIPDVYSDKGPEDDWGEENWPPIRVRVTVEEIEEPEEKS